MKYSNVFLSGLFLLYVTGCLSSTSSRTSEPVDSTITPPPPPEAAETLRTRGTVIFTDKTGPGQGVDKILKVVLVQETPDTLTFDVTYSYSGRNADKADVGIYPDMPHWAVSDTPVFTGTHTVSVEVFLQPEAQGGVKSTSLRLEIDGYREDTSSEKYQTQKYLGALYRRIVPFPKIWSHGGPARSTAQSAKYYSDIADELLGNGRMQEARDAYLIAEKYSRSLVEKTTVYHGLISVFYELGEYDNSKAYCNKLLHMSPHDQKAKALLEKIEAVKAAQTELSYQNANIVYNVNMGMYYNGTPLSEFTRSIPSFSLYKGKAHKKYKKDINYDPRTGRLIVRGLSPGGYYLWAKVDADGGNPIDFPGDFQGNVFFDVEYKGIETVPTPSFLDGEVKFNIDKIIHMTFPEDNAFYLAARRPDCGEETPLENPVHIEWEPLADDVEYKYVLTRYSCKPFMSAGIVKTGTLSGTSISLELPPIGENEIYLFELKAFKGDIQVGHLMTRTKNSTTWDYRFRVNVEVSGS
jgi:tetratricopeptide (TPR) repeat protein